MAKAIPTIKALYKWASAYKVPMDIRRWESVVRTYLLYVKFNSREESL